MKELLTEREVEETYNLNRRSLQRWHRHRSAIEYLEMDRKLL